MLKQSIRVGSAVILLLVCFAPRAEQISELDQFLPQETILYTVVKDVTQVKETARETAFYEVWDSEGMKAVRAQMSALWNKGVVRRTNIDPLTLLRAIKHDAVMGISFQFDPALGLPRGILFSLIVAADDPDGEIKKIVSSIKAAVLLSGAVATKVRTFEHAGAEVISLPLDENSEISIATMPEVALLCIGRPDLVTASIDRGKSKEPAGFTTSAMYPTVMGFHKEGDLSLVWWDVQNTVQTFQSLIGATQDQLDPMILFQHLGIDNCSYMFLRNYIAHRGFLLEQVIGFDGPTHGLLGFFLRPGELRAVGRFTPEEDFVIDMSLAPLEEGWNRLKGMVRAIGGEEAYKGMTTAIQAFEATLGISLEEDLFPSIGNEVALGVKGERFALLIQAKDEKKIGEIVPKLLTLWELEPETVESQGVTYNRVEIPDVGIALFFGVDRGYLVVSNSPEGYLQAVKEVPEKESIVASRRYGKALSHMPVANHFLTITDLRGMANYTTTIMNLQYALSGGQAYRPLDLSFLASETFPIVQVGVAQEDRYIQWSYSESGIDYVLSLYSALNSTLSGIAEQEGKRAVSICQADMRTIATALEGYFIDNTRYPETLEELLDPIAYLARIPIDPWTGKPYLYKQDGQTYILVGTGPNEKIDLDLASLEGPFTEDRIPEGAQYDPESGTTDGDIIYVGP